MTTAPTLHLYDTMRREKALFEPLDPANVRMYVCGPTVYDLAHIGNARPIIVFDMLFRLLRQIYGADHVTYVRNITDVDDKINARAARDGLTIDAVTSKTIAQFHADIAALGVLPPSVEPRATGHIQEMCALIERLVAQGHAYVASDHVLFEVGSFSAYGALSNRSVEEMRAGARVEVAPYKRDPMDFVLWKPSKDGEPGWPSPCGINVPGRPGWHIECSAMAGRHLGDVFDIHGGGVDLAFPHHENELAQTCAATGAPQMARVWMHNGFLQVEGEKMSKSLGNFITIQDLVAEWPGDALRLAMLSTQYRQPINWTEKNTADAMRAMTAFYDAAQPNEADLEAADDAPTENIDDEALAALCDDLNTPRAIAVLHALRQAAAHGDGAARQRLLHTGRLMGLFSMTHEAWKAMRSDRSAVDPDQVEELIAQRKAARAAKDFAEADRIRDTLAAMGVAIKDGADGTTWELA